MIKNIMPLAIFAVLLSGCAHDFMGEGEEENMETFDTIIYDETPEVKKSTAPTTEPTVKKYQPRQTGDAYND
jgi:hypothetical protein